MTLKNRKEDKMGVNRFGISPDRKIYDIVLHQYKFLLRSNIDDIKRYYHGIYKKLK